MNKKFKILLGFVLVVSMFFCMSSSFVVSQSEESGFWLRHYTLGENPTESLVYVPPAADITYDRLSSGPELSFIINQTNQINNNAIANPFALIDPENDQRTRVYNTTVMPYYGIVSIYVRFEGETFFRSRGTGFMISAHTVLTAAHCIDVSTLGPAVEIRAYPGKNGDTTYISADATDWYVYDDYTGEGDLDDDFAVIVLDDNIGTTSGWFQLYVPSSNNDLNGRSITITGYPNDKELLYGERFMWTASGSVTDVFPYTFYCNVDIMAGQSGSPAYFYSSGYKALGVLVAEVDYSAYPNYESYNICRRVDAAMYDWLELWGYIE